MNTATRTLDVNGGKDQFLNMEVNKQLSLIPRCEVSRNHLIERMIIFDSEII